MKISRKAASGVAATGIALAIVVGTALPGSAAQPTATPTPAQTFSVPPQTQAMRHPATLTALEELVSSGTLSAVELDPETEQVISASGHDLPATQSNQEALTKVAFAPNATSLIKAYVSTHRTDVRVDPTGRLLSVSFATK